MISRSASISIEELVENSQEYTAIIDTGVKVARKEIAQNHWGRVFNHFPPLMDSKLLYTHLERAKAINEISFARILPQNNNTKDSPKEIQYSLYLVDQKDNLESCKEAKMMQELLDTIVMHGIHALIDLDKGIIKYNVARTLLGCETKSNEKSGIGINQVPMILSSYVQNIIQFLTFQFEDSFEQIAKERLDNQVLSEYHTTLNFIFRYKELKNKIKLERLTENELNTLYKENPELCEVCDHRDSSEYIKRKFSPEFLHDYQQLKTEYEMKCMLWRVISNCAQKCWTSNSKAFETYCKEKILTAIRSAFVKEIKQSNTDLVTTENINKFLAHTITFLELVILLSKRIIENSSVSASASHTSLSLWTSPLNNAIEFKENSFSLWASPLNKKIEFKTTPTVNSERLTALRDRLNALLTSDERDIFDKEIEQHIETALYSAAYNGKKNTL